MRLYHLQEQEVHLSRPSNWLSLSSSVEKVVLVLKKMTFFMLVNGDRKRKIWSFVAYQFSLSHLSKSFFRLTKIT